MHAILVEVLIVLAFQRDDRPRRRERDESTFVGGQLVRLSPELMKIGRKPIRILGHHYMLNGQVMAVLDNDEPTGSNNQPGWTGIEIEGAPAKAPVRNIWIRQIL
jgi:hypothetical protein